MTAHAILAALSTKPATAAAMFAGVAGCLLVAIGVLVLFGRKS